MRWLRLDGYWSTWRRRALGLRGEGSRIFEQPRRESRVAAVKAIFSRRFEAILVVLAFPSFALAQFAPPCVFVEPTPGGVFGVDEAITLSLTHNDPEYQSWPAYLNFGSSLIRMEIRVKQMRISLPISVSQPGDLRCEATFGSFSSDFGFCNVGGCSIVGDVVPTPTPPSDLVPGTPVPWSAGITRVNVALDNLGPVSGTAKIGNFGTGDLFIMVFRTEYQMASAPVRFHESPEGKTLRPGEILELPFTIELDPAARETFEGIEYIDLRPRAAGYNPSVDFMIGLSAIVQVWFYETAADFPPTPTPRPTPTVWMSPTPWPTYSPEPSATASPSTTATPSPTATPSATTTPTATASPTLSPTQTPVPGPDQNLDGVVDAADVLFHAGAAGWILAEATSPRTPRPSATPTP